MPDILWRPETIRHGVQWSTKVLTSINGTEQRIARIQTPRQWMEASYLFDTDAQVQRAREDVLQSQKGDWRIPLWWDGYGFTNVSGGAVVATDTTLYFDTTVSDFAATDVVVLEDDITGATEIAIIQTVNAGNIVLTLGLSAGFAAWSRVYPLQTVRLRDSQQFRRNRAGNERTTLIADFDAPKAMGGAGGTLVTYQASGDLLAKQLLADAPLAPSDVGYSMASAIERMDSGAAFEQWTRYGEARMLESRKYAIADRAAMQRWKAFIDALVGQREPFFTPSFRDDLTLTSQPSTGASVIRVNINPPDYENDWWPFRYENLMLDTDAGEIYREVTSVAAGPGNTLDLTLDSALPATVAGSTINLISFLEHVRLSSDSIVFTHHVGARSEVDIGITTCPDAKDAPPPAGEWALVDAHTVGAEGPVDSIVWTGLLGNSEEEYLLHWKIFLSSASARDLQLRFNGSTSNRYSRTVRSSTLGTYTSTLVLHEMASNVNYATGDIQISAARYPRGGSVAFPRHYHGGGGYHVTTPAPAPLQCAGVWDNLADEITSIGLYLTTTGTDTLSALIATGSVAELWKRNLT